MNGEFLLQPIPLFFARIIIIIIINHSEAMRKKNFLFVLTTLIPFVVLAQGNPNDILLNIGERKITVEEFDYLYNKNHRDSANIYSKKSLEAYLPLFINFKLKVVEAEAQKLGDSEAFKNEFESYRRQLAKPYLTDRNSTSDLVAEAYERMQEEVRASHILVLVKPDEDTTEAYKKITEIREKAVAGADFGKLAQEHSEDPSAKTNQGDLGYFSALQMVYNFENAAYSIPVGGISQPVKTQFGYHLLNVVGKRPNQGSVKVAHIMVKVPDGSAENDSATAANKILEISTQLKGDPTRWNQLCKQFSDDTNTKALNGELPWFSTGQMPFEFAEAAFALQQPEDISKPIKTAFGWHIIKLLEKKPLAPLAEIEDNLKQRINQDARSQIRYTSFIDRLKKENNYSENSEQLKAILNEFDSSLVQGQWAYDTSKDWSNELFSVEGNTYKAADFLDFAQKQQRANPTTAPSDYAKALLNLFIEKQVLAAEEKKLPSKYPEYANLVQEYNDGMLFFEVMQKEIWQVSAADSAGLAQYFENNKEQYTWGKRAKGVVLNAESSEVLFKLKQAMQQNVYKTSEEPTTVNVAIDLETQNFSSSTRNAFNGAIRKLQLNKNYLLQLTLSETVEKWEELIANYFEQNKIEKTRLIFEKDNINDDEAILTFYSTALKDLQKQFNKENNALSVEIEEGWFDIDEHPVVRVIPSKKGTFDTNKNGRFYTAIIEEIEAPRQKTLAEAKGSVISDYQSFLEKEWLKSLKKKFNVKLNKRVFNSLVK